MAQIKNEQSYRAALKRISELLHGKAEPTLAIARAMVQKLSIPPEVVLGL